MEQTQPSPSAWERVPWSWICLVTGLLLTTLATLWVKGSRDRLAQTHLENHAQHVMSGLRHQVALYRNLLYAARGAMEAQPAMEWREWRAFVDQADIPNHYQGIKGLAFTAVVPRDQLPAYIASRTRPGMPPFELVSHGDHPTLFIIQFFEPLERNPQALGFDIASETDQRGSSDAATISTGTFIITPPIQHPITVPDQGPRLVFSLPVYRPGARVDSPESMRKAHLGWVSEAVWAHFLMGEVLKGETQDIALEWVTRGSDGRDVQIFAKAKDQPPGVLLSPMTFHLVVGGQAWKLTFQPTAAFDASAGRFRPHLVFAGGAMISLLLFALARALNLTWQRARVLAEKMTDSLRASTQLNQAQWEAMPLAAMVVDKEGRIQSWNKAAVHMFGYEAPEVCGRSLIDTLIQEDSRDAFRHLWRRLERGLEGQRAHHLGLTKQGLTPPCTWYGAVLRDAKQGFEGVAFLVDDLSERIKAEEALRHAQRLESLGMLAGGVAHDFNNLFTALLGNLSMARLQAVEGSPENRYLENAEAITFQASRFAQQLLAYSGKGTFHVEATHLSHLVGKLSNLLKAALPKLVVLQVDLAEALPKVQVDHAQFQQVIMNLVMNGAEAIGTDRTGLIRIVTRQTHLSATEGSLLHAGGPLPAGDYVSLEVHDTGCGMAPDVLERIFDPFFTTKPKGHGLGLSAILGILRAHGAGLSIQTREGTGTAFRIFLAPLAEGSSPQSHEHSGPIARHVARKGPCTLLLVDDEEELRAAAESMLAHLGCRVLLAEDGIQALECLAAHPEVDLVLMDLSMPRMGGVEAFLQIRSRWPRMRVILSSGYDQSHSIESLREMQPTGFLSKPYNLNNLNKAVQKALASLPEQEPNT